jgi:hypothetical protein
MKSNNYKQNNLKAFMITLKFTALLLTIIIIIIIIIIERRN